MTYETGGDGKRRSRVAGAEETWYNWDRKRVVLSEEDCADGATGALVCTFVGRNVAFSYGESPEIDDWFYVTRDVLFSTRGSWTEFRTLDSRLEFTAFGGDFVSEGDTPNVSRTFAGQQVDSLTGLHYRLYRSYSAEFSRWTSRDPIGLDDGPNMYAYVGGDPINFSDPTGQFRISNPGDCCGKQKKIYNAATLACANLSDWVTPEERRCVENRCKNNGKIKCKKCGGDMGSSLPFGYTAGVWVDNSNNFGEELEDTIIHEWLHTCGYHDTDTTDLVPPYGDGQ